MKKQKHQEQTDSLQSLSTPVKRRLNPEAATKKLLPVREISSKKQAPLPRLHEELSECGNIVTATKQSKDSSEEESTESDTSEIQAKKLLSTPKESSTSSTSSTPSIMSGTIEPMYSVISSLQRVPIMRSDSCSRNTISVILKY